MIKLEEKNNKKDNYEGPDLTKDAFFSDMENMEEEIASEAYSIVEHALSLIQSGFFDDAIEVLRQAIGLYQQINREAEIDALKAKIADIYVMKEQAFKEIGSKEVLGSGIETIESATSKGLGDTSNKISQLLEQANQLIKSNKFNEALDNYDKAIELSQKINNADKILGINKLIEECYNKKANFLREQSKQKEKRIITEDTQIERELSPEELKAMKLRAYEEGKKREENISNEAFDKIGKASDLAKMHQYDEAISLYREGASLFDEIGWQNESKKIYNTISYLESQKEKYLQEIERIKASERQKEILENQKASELDEYASVQQEEIMKTQVKKIAQITAKKEEKALFQKEISDMIESAEKLAREYDIDMKKAIKKGELVEKCIYPEVIRIYQESKNKVEEKGWKDQTAIFNSQIKKYKDLLEKDKKIREIEKEKERKQREYEELHRMKKPELVDIAERTFVLERPKIEDERIQIKNQIEFMANRAEKLAREYDVEFKKAIKKGDITLESKYPNIINIYSKIIEMANENGLNEEVAIYKTHIDKYEKLLEKEDRIKEIERKKREEKKLFEESYKIKKTGIPTVSDVNKVDLLHGESEIKDSEAKIEQEIDDMVSRAEKMAREYEVGIKKGDFDLICPYPEIIEIYKEIRKKVYAWGWQGEAELYTNQIKIYQEKLQKDIKLRELEQEKHKKQLQYEEAMKSSNREKVSKYITLKEEEEKEDQTDIIFNKAMDLINKTENEVKSYELSMKKDILTITSPYENAIKNYENARKLLFQIGWNDEALKLNDTISLYKQKKARDDKLRSIEIEKSKKEKIKIDVAGGSTEAPFFAEEKKRIELEKLKKQKSKEADFVFELINRAENMAKNYEMKKKEGNILNLKSPYQEIINTYKVAQEKFKEIEWVEQASQLDNTIKYYKERMDSDERLRLLEQERFKKEQEELQKMKFESKMAKEAEEELKRQKAKALEIKRKQQLRYDAKKEQAFNFMDLAKKELAQNNFDKAINFYKESEKIFADINWPEGIRMINESVKIIERKKEKFELEQRYLKEREEERKRLESEIKQQITKAQDLKKLQEEQRKQEFLELQKEKEKEKEIAEQAYQLLEEGTKLKDKKFFEKAYEKYIMGRDLFSKLDWQHEVSRINNDLLFILKKEMKQAEKIKTMQEKKVEEQKELEVLLKEADLKQQELEKIRKQEKRKEREKRIEEEMENANSVIKDLKYNEAILRLKKVIKKLEQVGNKKLIKQIKNKIEVLKNASQIPLIAIEDIEKSEYIDQYKLAFKTLDKAQLSLSKNLFMRAISELNEALYNLRETKLGDKYIPILNEKINICKKEIGIEITPEPEKKEAAPKVEIDDLKAKIAARRAERRKKIRDLMDE